MDTYTDTFLFAVMFTIRFVSVEVCLCESVLYFGNLYINDMAKDDSTEMIFENIYYLKCEFRKNAEFVYLFDK